MRIFVLTFTGISYGNHIDENICAEFSLVERRGSHAPAWYTRLIYIFVILRRSWKDILMFPSPTPWRFPVKGYVTFSARNHREPKSIFSKNHFSSSEIIPNFTKKTWEKCWLCSICFTKVLMGIGIKKERFFHTTDMLSVLYEFLWVLGMSILHCLHSYPSNLLLNVNQKQ